MMSVWCYVANAIAVLTRGRQTCYYGCNMLSYLPKRLFSPFFKRPFSPITMADACGLTTFILSFFNFLPMRLPALPTNRCSNFVSKANPAFPLTSALSRQSRNMTIYSNFFCRCACPPLYVVPRRF